MLDNAHGGSAKFPVGVYCPRFQNGAVGKTSFVKIIPLARLNSRLRCHELAFSRQKLPNINFLKTKFTKSLDFNTENNKI